jgi:hypothetical protein
MASGRIRSTRWDTAGPHSLTKEGGNDDEGVQKLCYPLSLSLTAQQGQEQYSLLLLPTWHLLSQISIGCLVPILNVANTNSIVVWAHKCTCRWMHFNLFLFLQEIGGSTRASIG